MTKKRSNAEEDEEFSNKEKPNSKEKVKKKRVTIQRPAALTQGQLSDSYESESSQSEKIEEGPTSPRPHSRNIFSSKHSIIRNRKAHAKLPNTALYSTIKLDPIQDVVDFDGLGKQSLHAKAKKETGGVLNPYRKWGAHRALCENPNGGYLVEIIDGIERITRIEPNSTPPMEPKSSSQILLTKPNEMANSQTLLGSLKPLPGEADNESKRIAEEMDRISWDGGFKETSFPKKEKKKSDDKDEGKEREDNRQLMMKVRRKQPKEKKEGTIRKTKGSRRRKGSDSNTGSDSGSKGKSKSTDESGECTEEEEGSKTSLISKITKFVPKRFKGSHRKKKSK